LNLGEDACCCPFVGVGIRTAPDRSFSLLLYSFANVQRRKEEKKKSEEEGKVHDLKALE
jgi:hypothetical protein